MCNFFSSCLQISPFGLLLNLQEHWHSLNLNYWKRKMRRIKEEGHPDPWCLSFCLPSLVVSSVAI